MKDIKIIVATHKKYRMPNDNMYLPMQVGAKGKVNIGYQTEIKIKQKIKDLNNECRDVIVRMLQQPTCTNACIQDEKIVVDIILEVIAEVIGEAKMVVAVLSPVDNCEPIDDDFENEINENFMNVN